MSVQLAVSCYNVTICITQQNLTQFRGTQQNTSFGVRGRVMRYWGYVVECND